MYLFRLLGLFVEAVQASFGEIAYNPELIHYVKGMVEDTIPNQAPEEIAILRLEKCNAFSMRAGIGPNA